jgi:tetratricopeptide (TPR) repeat protein
MSTLLTLEQQVECLTGQVGQIKKDLLDFLRISEVSIPKALATARTLIEYFVGAVLRDEGIPADRDLMVNIEMLGAKDGRDAARRRKQPGSPTPPPVLPVQLYSSLHNLRIYGNVVVHPWDAATMERKEARLTAVDLQVVLGQILRVAEWYFTQYRKPPVDPLYEGLPEPALGKWCDVPPEAAGFRGREEELSRLGRLLRDGPARVITVAASAGMGKTSLAARAAAAFATEGGRDRRLLLWVDLKAAPSFVEVSARILASLTEGARPADLSITRLSPSARAGQIVRRMAERPVLLVLDNFESWLDPCGRPPDPAVAQLLEMSATREHRGRVLLTSRLPPDVPGLSPGMEVLTLGPLARPAAEALIQSQGVTGTGAAHAAVYDQLGGNPRLLLLLAEVLMKRRCRDLDRGLQRFPGVVRGQADGLLAEVWSELTDGGRRVLQALAVLRPPATPAAIGGTLSRLVPGSPVDVEDLLWGQLVPRTLVAPTADGSGFAFEHPLLLDFSLRRGDVRPAHRAALAYFQSLLEGAANADGVFRSVIHHAMVLGEYETAAASLTDPRFRLPLLRRGGTAELLELARALLPQAGRLTPLARNRVRRTAAVCEEVFGHYTAARDLLETCREEPGEWRGTPDECGLLRESCSVLRKLFQFEEAERAGLAGLALARSLGLAEEEARALKELAALARQRRRPAESACLARESVAVADRSGDAYVRATTRFYLGRTLEAGGELAAARALYREALELAGQAGVLPLRSFCLTSLADIARRQADHQEGLGLINEALDLIHRLGDRMQEGVACRCRALLLLRMGKQHREEAVADLRHALRLVFDPEHPAEVATMLLDLAPLLVPDASLSDPTGLPPARSFAVSAACVGVSLELTRRLEVVREGAQRDLARLRAAVERLGGSWEEIERTVAADRPALLQEATGIAAESWRTLLAGTGTAPTVPEDECAAPTTPGNA